MMKTLITTQQVREGLNNKDLTQANGRIAVIVTIPVSARKQTLGVQFWTAQQIEEGTAKNTDGTISKLVELY